MLAWATAAAARDRGAWESGFVRRDGVKRTWRLYVPATAAGAAGARPLILVLHGGGGRGRGMPRLLRGRFEALADRDGFLVAYPDGVGRSWNDGREAPVIAAQERGVDDVGFVRDLLDAVGRAHPTDPARVFACGISNGGFMSCRLACDLGDRIAAIGVVAAALPGPVAARCVPARPVSAILLCGTADPLVPFAGGTVRVVERGRARGEALGARDTALRFAAAAGCTMIPRGPEELPDADPADGTRTIRETWGPGRDGAEVVLCTIREGGHTWPGGRQYLPASLVGRVCRDLDGCDALWEFFRAHARAHP